MKCDVCGAKQSEGAEIWMFVEKDDPSKTVKRRCKQHLGA